MVPLGRIRPKRPQLPATSFSLGGLIVGNAPASAGAFFLVLARVLAWPALLPAVRFQRWMGPCRDTKPIPTTRRSIPNMSFTLPSTRSESGDAWTFQDRFLPSGKANNTLRCVAGSKACLCAAAWCRADAERSGYTFIARFAESWAGTRAQRSRWDCSLTLNRASRLCRKIWRQRWQTRRPL